MTQALAVICIALSAPEGRVYRLEGETRKPQLVAWHGEKPCDMDDLPVHESVLRAVRGRDLVVTSGATALERRGAVHATSVAVPLIVQGEVLGALHMLMLLSDETPSWATNPELQTLQILCNELAVALDNALLRRKVQEAALITGKR